MTEEEQQQAAELEALAQQEQQAEAVEGEWQPSDNAEQVGMSTADILAPLLKISFGLIASVKGQHWQLTDEVATEAAAEYGRCIDYYFPDMNTAPWVGAAMTTGMILAPRIMQDNQIARTRAQAESEQTATETGENDGD